MQAPKVKKPCTSLSMHPEPEGSMTTPEDEAAPPRPSSQASSVEMLSQVSAMSQDLFPESEDEDVENTLGGEEDLFPEIPANNIPIDQSHRTNGAGDHRSSDLNATQSTSSSSTADQSHQGITPKHTTQENTVVKTQAARPDGYDEKVDEPLLCPNRRRYVVFPIKYPDIWSFYKKAQGGL